MLINYIILISFLLFIIFFSIFYSQTQYKNDNYSSPTTGVSFKLLNRKIEYSNIKLKKKRIKNEFINDKWIVITSIKDPLNILDLFNNSYNRWTKLIIGDYKSPFTKYKNNKENLIYLSLEDQQELNYNIIKTIPISSFSRKNIGYLYAINHGAKMILDLDDDNYLYKEEDLNNILNHNINIELESNQIVSNPYSLFYNEKIWPRGFPLELINNISQRLLENKQNKNIIIQLLQNIDPDVDAIYRLTNSKEINFYNTNKCISINKSIYSPFNAQSTIHYYESFPYLLLPSSVHGRVSDIWRSYIAETIMNKYNESISFCNPVINHIRNKHNYLNDMNSELPLYFQSNILLNYLRNYELKCNNKIECLRKIYYELYRIGIIEINDIKLINNWIKDIYNIIN